MIPTLQINAINAKSNQNIAGAGGANKLIVTQSNNTARSLPDDNNNKRIQNFIVVGETGGLESQMIPNNPAIVNRINSN